jgi:hypothetical protein
VKRVEYFHAVEMKRLSFRDLRVWYRRGRAILAKKNFIYEFFQPLWTRAWGFSNLQTPRNLCNELTAEAVIITQGDYINETLLVDR